MLDRDAEEAGDLREVQFIERPHAALPRRPLLWGNAERFGAFFPAAASGVLFHAASADVGGDDLPQVFRDFPHALYPSMTISHIGGACPPIPLHPIALPVSAMRI